MKKIAIGLLIVLSVYVGLYKKPFLCISPKLNAIGFTDKNRGVYLNTYPQDSLDTIEEMRQYFISMSDGKASADDIKELKEATATRPDFTMGLIIGMQSGIRSYITSSPEDQKEMVKSANYMTQQFLPEIRNMLNIKTPRE